jgi:hypothetical protein
MVKSPASEIVKTLRSFGDQANLIDLLDRLLFLKAVGGCFHGIRSSDMLANSSASFPNPLLNTAEF